MDINNKISCIAVDDEPLALDQMKDFIGRVDFLDLRYSFYSATDALNFLKRTKIDLIFLDIQMDELNGIQFLEVLKDKPYIVFTTAYDTYALKGYELEVIDYLLKPISFQRFLKTANRIYDLKFEAHDKPKIVKTENQSGFNDFVFVKTKYRLQKINYTDILYIEGMSNYVTIHTENEKIYSLQTFQNLLDLLPSNRFVRIHKSYIISIEKIEQISKNQVYVKNISIPIGESYKQYFIDFLKANKINF